MTACSYKEICQRYFKPKCLSYLMSQFKSAVTVVSVASAFSKGKKRKCFTSSCTLGNFEEAVDKQNIIPPHIHASTGDLIGLKSSVASFSLSLRERGKDNATLLHHAAQGSQLPVMEYLLKNEIELDAVDNLGNTALHYSVMAGHVEGINLLLDAGASTNFLNKARNSPLHLAAKDLTGKALNACLSHPVDIFIKGPRNRNLFHVLAEVDNVKGYRLIKENLGNVICSENDLIDKLSIGDEDGFSPIHLAARKNSHQVLEYIFNCWKEKGFSIDKVFELINEENSTPLHVAVDGGNYEVVCVLLKFGARASILKEDISPPLHLACSLGRLDIVKAMVEYRGIGIFKKVDCYQRTPLHYSVLSIHSTSLISYILTNGEDIDIDQQDSRGKTPLHLSITSGNLCAVKELLSRGADPSVKDKNGCNALHLAVCHNRKPIIHELLEISNSRELIMDINSKGYSPIHIGLKQGLGNIIMSVVSPLLAHCNSKCLFIKDSLGNNYVHLVAASGDSKSLLELLDLPSTHKLLNDTNTCGETPLHTAASKGQAHCIELLLNRGAMVHKCYKGLTPLMLACSNGHMDCARLLYKAHSFQIDWQDSNGDTALHYAAGSGSPPMVQYCLDLPSKVLHNDMGKSFFDMIIDSKDEDCALAVVNHKRWQECMDAVSPVEEPAMIKLVKKIPSIASTVLDRCHKKKCHGRGSYTDILNFKYLFTFDTPQLDNIRKSKPEKPLQRRKSMYKIGAGEADMEAGNSTIVKYRRSSTRRSINATTSEQRHSSTMEVLRTMVRHKRIDLLAHPVVTEYVNLKWKHYGQFIYYFMYIFAFVHTFCLSVFAVYGSVSAGVGNDSSVTYNTSTNESQILDVSLQMSNFGRVMKWIALSSDIALILFLLSSLLRLRFNFFNLQAVFCLMSTVFSFLFLVRSNPFNNVWIGSIACFFSWVQLFGALKFASVIGIYVVIFFKILLRAFQVLFLSIFLIIAFALPLFLLTQNMQEFSTFGYSIFSVFGYMLGEIQYEAFIDSKSNSSLLIITVVMLAIMMTIVMANLLIGLAVGDIEQSKQSALYDNMVLVVNYLFKVDESMPKYFKQKVLNIFVHVDEKNQINFSYHKTLGLKKWKLLNILKRLLKVGHKALDSSVQLEEGDNSSSSTIAPPADVATELAQIKTKMHEILDVLHHSQFEKDNNLDNFHRWKGRRFRWQMAESASGSMVSSQSDLSGSVADFMV